MSLFQLGNTQFPVSKIALGCWGFAGGSMWGEQTESDSIDTVQRSFRIGHQLFRKCPRLWGWVCRRSPR